MSADNVVSKHGDNSLYSQALRLAPGAGIGILHDLYPTNSSQYNSIQKLNSERSRLKIPFMQYGECLHGVASFKQSMFPQSIAMAASFDTDLVHRIGSALGAEARSIGIHACLSPVLDLGLEPRWGRGQLWQRRGVGDEIWLISNENSPGSLGRGYVADKLYGCCHDIRAIQKWIMGSS
jgi:beta-glucosidase-like glycosyl hydrolase